MGRVYFAAIVTVGLVLAIAWAWPVGRPYLLPAIGAALAAAIVQGAHPAPHRLRRATIAAAFAVALVVGASRWLHVVMGAAYPEVPPLRHAFWFPAALVGIVALVNLLDARRL